MTSAFTTPTTRRRNDHQRRESTSDRLDASQPSSARRYDYWLGGKDHFAADRHSGDRIATAFPTVHTAAKENRRFVHRAVTYLTGEAGIRQLLDIGCGIPTTPTVHETAQRIAPAARVIYVDNDPMVIAHTRARTSSSPQGAVACLHADLRDPDSILNNPALTSILDPNRPVAVLLCAVLHYLHDQDQPAEILKRLKEALPPGSCLALTHATLDPLPSATALAVTELLGTGHGAIRPRTRAEVTALTAGLPLVQPGLVPVTRWRPHLPPQPHATAQATATYGLMAQLP
ncbi:SAM-dependent methyltransferase [Plantactinospora siamensis]|uniref:SAM-dependent methyltransferase n=1 Tax=Plantactinospora siamensis TaxID=555372 RepID=A0ABV6P5K7_9ACTN